MSRELIEKMRDAMLYEREQWVGIRTNKGKKKPFELVRHSDPEAVTPVVMAAWSNYEDADREAPLVIEAAIARAILSLLADPANIPSDLAVALAKAVVDKQPYSTDEWRDVFAAAFAKERADNLTGERKP